MANLCISSYQKHIFSKKLNKTKIENLKHVKTSTYENHTYAKRKEEAKSHHFSDCV